MRVIGTAGHVDHGKSTLIEALTGTHPDRLKEEREREMTIDLGFAWWTLPDGEEVGVVDVPGHRDFIANMLSGIGGIDAVLFVIAADEGVMPQTREHLDIINLLQIESGLIALTKTDLVADEDWLDLIEQDVMQLLEETSIANSEIIRVSAKNGQGLARIQQALGELLALHPPKADLARPRLPIDRVFTMSGFGTVVTGTMADGSFQVGDQVEIMPAGIQGRIRGLQTHKRKEEVAYPGSRTAVNISGVDVDEIERGNVLTYPDMYAKTRLVDVRFNHLPKVDKPLKHDTEVKFYTGASEVIGRVRLLGQKTLEPGEQAWLQLELKSPVVVARGDRYILRRPSPGETIGGGEIVNPQPDQLHKRFDPDIIQRMEALSKGLPTDVLLHAVEKGGVSTLGEAIDRSKLEIDIAHAAARELVQDNRLSLLQGDEDKLLQEDVVAPTLLWNSLINKVLGLLDEFHSEQPLRSGIAREEVKSRLKLSQLDIKLLVKHLADTNQITESGPLLQLPGHQIRFSPAQQKGIDSLLVKFENSPYAPPSIKEVIDILGDAVYQALVDLGELLPVSSEVVFQTKDYQKMVKELTKIMQTQGSISVAAARDHFGTTRRYILAFLEYLDTVGMTKREGDVRVLK
ncbi:MAG: selenocysteine-specific translation elongation factor [Chloroflexota bacterium]